MSKQKCFPYNSEPCTMSESFPDLPKRFPPYYLCQYNQRNTMNETIDNRREAFVRFGNQVNRGENVGYQITPSAWWRVKQAPRNTFQQFGNDEVLTYDVVNLDGSGDKFYGYARNVDVESELFKINYLNDKCFDADFKINPNYPNTSLYKYKDVINNHNTIEQLNTLPTVSTNMMMPQVSEANINPLKDEYLKAQINTYRDPRMAPNKCMDKSTPQPTNQTFGPFHYKDEVNYFVVGPGFDNNPASCYPPENTWNNMTKRKMLYHRQFDKN
jgi:hypothetical protein